MVQKKDMTSESRLERTRVGARDVHFTAAITYGTILERFEMGNITTISYSVLNTAFGWKIKDSEWKNIPGVFGFAPCI